MFHKAHLDALHEYSADPIPESSTNAQRWYDGLSFSKPISDLPREVTRASLLQMSKNASVPTFTLMAAILAWGGRNVKRQARSILSSEDLIALVESVRAGKLSRADAYREISALSVWGIGPAFFTKFIYFALPRDGRPIGFIMDQWLACSVNLLLETPDVVKVDASYLWTIKKGRLVLQSTFFVSKLNTAYDYEQFCASVECVAEVLGVGSDDVEGILFSKPGSGRWRNYVTANRAPPFASNI